MATFMIGEVAERVGLRPSALRYYEEIGLLPEPERVSGRRVYGAEVFQQVAGIQLAKQAGFTLEEIGLLLSGSAEETAGGFSDQWQRLAHSKLEELDALIASAERMKQRLQDGLICRCQTLEGCDIVAEKSAEMLD